MAAPPDLQHGFTLGPFSILPERNIVRWEGNESHLEPKQMKALMTLATHQPGVVSKQLLVDEVWGGRATSDESITGCIKGLRAALDNDSPREPKYIETIHGRGYRLKLSPVLAEKSQSVATPRNWLPGIAVAILFVTVATLWFTRSSPPSPAPVQIDSVVITRFANMSSEATQPTVDGITEQLVSTLYEVPGLQIKKGSLPAENESARDIADRYGVGWVVFGSVQQMDGQIKIAARIDDRNNLVKWADTFPGSDAEIFELHEQVATAVRNAILGEDEKTVTASSRPSNAEAYDKYLLGQFYLAKRDLASLNQAVAFFSASIEMDPGYGPAYFDLANTYLLLADYDSGAKEKIFDLAIATVEKGVEKDPKILNAAQTIHGYVDSKRGNWMAATKAFNIATNGVVDYPVSHHYHSVMLAAVGRIDESLKAALRAREMEPDSQVLNSRLAIAYFWKNDMANARRFYDIANAMGSGAPISQLSYALFLVRDGRIGEAQEFVRRAMILLEVEPSWIDPLFDELAKPAESRSLDSILPEDIVSQGAIPPNVLIAALAIAGQVDRAIEIAWRLVDDPSYFDIEMIYLDEFREFRQHADFPQLLDQLGLSDYWRNTGCRWVDDRLSCTDS
jgi:DNA-binding winged helix-turn-helix (wHTH) protein/TolB-like protein